MEFPITGTKNPAVNKNFNLNDPVDRRRYFHAKAGKQIERLKEYLDKNTFVGFLLAKKQAGKGTYSKLFTEVFGSDRFSHISVGDVVREVHQQLIKNPEKIKELKTYLKSNYRGFISPEEAIESILGRSMKTLIPTEVILALVKREIGRLGEVAVFIDGFPRNLDQISYSLYFREIMNLRADPDFFVLIQVPESVINARMESRVICPLCQISRTPKLLPTKYVAYSEEQQEFVLKCDNPDCPGCGSEILIRKEGADLGIEALKDRIQTDDELIKRASSLHGVPKVLLRNTVPIKHLDKFDEYEITPEYSYERASPSGEVKVIKQPWIIKDDAGVDSYSLLAAPVALSLIYQIHDLLGLGK